MRNLKALKVECLKTLRRVFEKSLLWILDTENPIFGEVTAISMDGLVSSGDLSPIERFISVHLTNDLRCTVERKDTNNQEEMFLFF